MSHNLGRAFVLAGLLLCPMFFLGCPTPIHSCSTNSDCPARSACAQDLKVCVESPPGKNAGALDAGADGLDASTPDSGTVSPQSTSSLAPSSGSAFGDKVMKNAHYKVMGSLSEPTPTAQGGVVEMHNSSYRCIGVFNATLRK